MPNNYPWLDEYLLSKPGARKDFKAEWGWFRYLVGDKMFAATCKPDEKHKAPYAGNELLTLKVAPADGEFFRAQYPDIHPGFYTDKRCWVSVLLGGETPESVLRELCDASYSLVLAKLTKREREAIASGAKRD